ncbi:MAG: hypothetical protein AAGD14_04900 [Planctomycetota bacterium]
MTSSSIATIIATLALGGVIFLGFSGDEAPTTRTPTRAVSADTAELEALRYEISQLKGRIEQLESVERTTPARAAPARIDEQPDAPSDEAAPTNAAPEPDPELRRAQREEARAERAQRWANARLDRLVENGQIGELTDDQKTKVNEKLRSFQTNMFTRLRELRDDPANEGLERAERQELYRAEMETMRKDAANDLATVVPAADAEVIVQQMTSRARGNNGRNRRRGRNR